MSLKLKTIEEINHSWDALVAQHTGAILDAIQDWYINQGMNGSEAYAEAYTDFNAASESEIQSWLEHLDLLPPADEWFFS